MSVKRAIRKAVDTAIYPGSVKNLSRTLSRDRSNEPTEKFMRSTSESMFGGSKRDTTRSRPMPSKAAATRSTRGSTDAGASTPAPSFAQKGEIFSNQSKDLKKRARYFSKMSEEDHEHPGRWAAAVQSLKASKDSKAAADSSKSYKRKK